MRETFIITFDFFTVGFNDVQIATLFQIILMLVPRTVETGQALIELLIKGENFLGKS